MNNLTCVLGCPGKNYTSDLVRDPSLTSFRLTFVFVLCLPICAPCQFSASPPAQTFQNSYIGHPMVSWLLYGRRLFVAASSCGVWWWWSGVFVIDDGGRTHWLASQCCCWYRLGGASLEQPHWQVRRWWWWRSWGGGIGSRGGWCMVGCAQWRRRLTN